MQNLRAQTLQAVMQAKQNARQTVTKMKYTKIYKQRMVSFKGEGTSHIALPLPELAQTFPKTMALIQKERWGGSLAYTMPFPDRLKQTSCYNGFHRSFQISDAVKT